MDFQQTSSNWKALTPDDLPDDIRTNFSTEFLVASKLRDWLISQFETQCGIQFRPVVWDELDLEIFRKWWMFQEISGQITVRIKTYFETLIYSSNTQKIIKISQRNCHICHGLVPVDLQFPISIIPIRIKPRSRQSISKVNWNLFQKAIKSHFYINNKIFQKNKYYCVAITYVLKIISNDRDLDNMTKALMDAFCRAIGIDDKDIHHLDALKVRGDVTDEYVCIRIAPSHLQGNTMVMVPSFDVDWAGQEHLNLDDFRD